MSLFLRKFREGIVGFLGVVALVGVVLALLGYAAVSEFPDAAAGAAVGYVRWGACIAVIAVLLNGIGAIIATVKSRSLDRAVSSIELPPPVPFDGKPIQSGDPSAPNRPWTAPSAPKAEG